MLTTFYPHPGYHTVARSTSDGTMVSEIVKTASGALVGAIAGAVYVLVVGVLEIHSIGARAGAVYDLNNVVVGITRPGVPWLQLVAIALVSASILYVGAFELRGIPQRPATAGVVSFVAVCLASIGWALVELSQSLVDGGAQSGVSEGLRGWIEKGGQHAAVHVVALFGLGILLLRSRSHRNPPATQNGESSDAWVEAREEDL